MEKSMEQRLKSMANVLRDAATEAENCSKYYKHTEDLQLSLCQLKSENQLLQKTLEKMKDKEKDRENEFRAAMNKEQATQRVKENEFRAALNKEQAKQRDKENEFRADLKNEQAKTSTLQSRLKESLSIQDELREKLQEHFRKKSNVNDISDALRPTKIAENYKELQDNHWVDAYEEFEKYFNSEKSITQALVCVLKNVMEFCGAMSEKQTVQLQSSLLFTEAKADSEVSQTIKRELISCKKELASETMENLYELYLTKLRQSKEFAMKKELGIKPFVRECIRVCWMCLIQVPAMKIDFESGARGRHFNTDVYRPYTKSGEYIEYIVWPALLLSENGPVIEKGIAQGTQIQWQSPTKETFCGKRAGPFVSETYKDVSKSETNLSAQCSYQKDTYRDLPIEKETNFSEVFNFGGQRKKASAKIGVNEKKAVSEAKYKRFQYDGDGYGSKQRRAFFEERSRRADRLPKFKDMFNRREEKDRSRAKSADARYPSPKRDGRRNSYVFH